MQVGWCLKGEKRIFGSGRRRISGGSTVPVSPVQCLAGTGASELAAAVVGQRRNEYFQVAPALWRPGPRRAQIPASQSRIAPGCKVHRGTRAKMHLRWLRAIHTDESGPKSSRFINSSSAQILQRDRALDFLKTVSLSLSASHTLDNHPTPTFECRCAHPKLPAPASKTACWSGDPAIHAGLGFAINYGAGPPFEVVGGS